MFIYIYLQISWYAAFLYDSIWLAARALDATTKQGYNISNVTATVKNMFNNTFTGERNFIGLFALLVKKKENVDC